MAQVKNIDPAIVAALRDVRDGKAASLEFAQLRSLVELGLVAPTPDGYQLSFAGKHRVGSSARAEGGRRGSGAEGGSVR